MEQFKQGDKPIGEKLGENASQEKKVQDGDNQEKFKIPEDVKQGTAEMVGYELRNSILRTEELVEKDPDSEVDKKHLEDYKLQEAMLGAPVINIERRKKINEENPQELSEKQLQEIIKNFSAMDMSELVEEHFVSRFMKTKKEKGLVDDLDEYHSNFPKTDIEKLLRAARSLQHRLDHEQKVGDNKAMAEANEKKALEDAMADVRQKIKDINPNKTQEDIKKETSLKTNKLLSFLRVGKIDSVLEMIKSDSENLQDFLASEQAKEVAHEGVIVNIKMGEMEKVSEIIKVFDVSDEFLKQSEELHQAIGEGISYFLKLERFDKITEIIKPDFIRNYINGPIYKVPEVGKVLEENISSFIKSDEIDKIEELRKQPWFHGGIFQYPEIKKELKSKIISFMKSDQIDKIEELRKQPWFSGDIIQNLEKDGFAKVKIEQLLKKGKNQDAINIGKIFGITEYFIKELMQKKK